MKPIPCQRHLFDIPDDVAYLNCAYMAPLMKHVVAAGHKAVAAKARPWDILPGQFSEQSERARALFAGIVNATADDIAIVPAVSYAAATAAQNVSVGAGSEIIVLKDQFPSNVYPWRELAREKGARVVTVDLAGGDGCDDSSDMTAAVIEAINERTALAALPHCRWTDGALLDLEAIGARCRDVGAALFLDLTQSAGAWPFDTQAVRPDFMVAAGYKWLLGPYTLGFMYVSPQWQQQGKPLEHNWIAREKSEIFSELVNYRDTFQPGARRFDMGERSSFHLMPMATAGLEQLASWGIERIAATLAARNEAIIERAAALGLVAAPGHLRAGHYLGLRSERPISDALPARLGAEKVFVSLRGRSIRVTPYLYNTDDDIDRFFNVLRIALDEC